MTSRERVKRALSFETVDRVPIENDFGGRLGSLYTSDVAKSPYRYPAGRSWGEEERKGLHMDIWGCLWVDILPDLVEIGVDAVNAQLFCMPIERLGDEYAGRICFWGKDHRLENCEAVYDEWRKL